MPTTPREKFASARPAHSTVLEKAFAGVPAGSALHIPSPPTLAERIRALPPGTTTSLPALRQVIAVAEDADATCPVTTAIHLRTVVEVAMLDLADGADPADVVPFWRVLGPDDTVTTKVPGAREVIEAQRAAEA